MVKKQKRQTDESRLVTMSEEEFLMLWDRISEDRSEFLKNYHTVLNGRFDVGGFSSLPIYYSLLKEIAGCYPQDNIMQAGVERIAKMYPRLKK